MSGKAPGKVAKNLQLGTEFLLPHSALKFGGARVVVVRRVWLPAEWIEGQMIEPARVQLEFSGIDIKEIRGEIVLAAGAVVIIP